jgi:hypothetical protein
MYFSKTRSSGVYRHDTGFHDVKRFRNLNLGITGSFASFGNSRGKSSSKVMIKSPSSLKAGELVIIGTTLWRKAFAPTRPPVSPSAHSFGAVPSCPSWQRLGVMKEKFAVVCHHVVV